LTGTIGAAHARGVLRALPCALVIAACSPPARSTARWTPATLSTDAYESTPTFSADGREVFFFRADRQFRNYRLLMSTCGPDGWSAPRPPPFAAPPPIVEADPWLTPDGRRLYFVSSRQDHAATNGENLDIWYVDRAGDGWAELVRLPEPIYSPGSELLPRVLADGRLVFGSHRAGGHGQSDIYTATPHPDGTWTLENLGPAINTAASEYEAEASPDGRTLIVVSDRGGRSHLYRFTRTRDGWSPPERLPGKDDVFQVGPVLSPRGDRLLFAQADGARSGELFVVDLAANADPTWPPRCPSRTRLRHAGGRYSGR
jgi:Tol biopolymer transport system component